MKRWILAGLLALGLSPLAAHEHRAPHGGSLQAFGDEFAHLELVLDPAAGRLTAYALDGEAERPLRLKQRTVSLHVTRCTPKRPPFTLRLRAVANPLTGETVGASSQFEGAAPALVGVRAFEATSGPVELRGRRFAYNRIVHPGGNEEAGR